MMRSFILFLLHMSSINAFDLYPDNYVTVLFSELVRLLNTLTYSTFWANHHENIPI